MRKKVGIVTIQSINYGNRLQNYALQEIIKKLNFDVYSIKRFDETLSIKEKVSECIKKVLQHLMFSKILNFKKFDKNIQYSNYRVGVNFAPEGLSDSFDYFITGSDQVWNPFFKCVGKCDLLNFAEDTKRISYAASFGVSKFPEEKKEEWIKELIKFKAISVREEEGKKIIKNLVPNYAEVVLDPTLLLEKKEWEKVERRTNLRPKEKYCFVYALNKKNKAFEEKIEELSKEYKIIDIMKKGFLGVALRLGPGEFLNLISGADVVLTNSFHATVFSILYKKNVYTFGRIDMDMNSRIRTLANIVGLSQNFDAMGTFSITSDFEREIIEKKLKIEREKSIDFLKKSLE